LALVSTLIGAEVYSERVPIFVVQKHDASRLHYDFRLEVDGALRSWAVPKGPSTDPRDKRLAVPVEDHSLDHADFEGVIAEGYGAGRVIVWDTGEYENVGRRAMTQALEAGHVVVRLEGRKLRGGFALQRLAADRWLLIKTDDEHADRDRDVLAERPESALTGRTLDDLR
jgi:DNA ligase D-like protein (predicted 3'-phosphoesterase)